MENTLALTMLNRIWQEYCDLIIPKKNHNTINNSDMIEEFFFVLLGGYGINYEQNLSGLQVLKKKGYIKKKLYNHENAMNETARRLEAEFNIKQFEPSTVKGGLRKYRFIKSKSLQIAKAGYWLWNECEWDIKGKTLQLGSLQSRKWLCSCPGIGMKSASWYLRNMGINSDCAVIDVHIMRFLNSVGMNVPKNLTDKTYLQIEESLRNICSQIGASLGAMDYLIWWLSREGLLDKG